MNNGGAPEIVVVGGGAVGLCTALELARRGARPVVLERGPDLVSGCSAGSAGLLSPGHSTPLANLGSLREGLVHMLRRDSPFSIRPRPRMIPWILRYVAACIPSRVQAGTELIRALSVASLRMHEELAQEGLDTGFARHGALNVYATETGFQKGCREAAVQAAEGVESQVMDLAAAREFESAIGARVIGAVFYPNEAHCIPRLFMRSVGQAARDAGAQIRCRVEVSGFEVRDGRVLAVRTSEGDLRPAAVILANGAWVARSARQLGLSIPIEGGKGYHVDLSAVGSDPRVPVYIQEARVIATPMDGILRLAGTLQLSGLSMKIDDARVRSIIEAGRHTLRGIEDARITEIWRGIRPCTPDGLPIIGRTERVENLTFAAGHAMKGLHLAPVTGRIVAEIVEGKEAGTESFPMSPDRFRPVPVVRSSSSASDKRTTHWTYKSLRGPGRAKLGQHTSNAGRREVMWILA